MDIIVSANNNKEILIFPVVPQDNELSIPQNNEEFETLKGTINLIGNIGLRTLNISSMFPTHNYRWLKKGSISNGWIYVDFFEKWRKAKIPIRIVMTKEDSSEWLNMGVLVNNFTYSIKRNKDISYSLDLVEYKMLEV